MLVTLFYLHEFGLIWFLTSEIAELLFLESNFEAFCYLDKLNTKSSALISQNQFSIIFYLYSNLFFMFVCLFVFRHTLILSAFQVKSFQQKRVTS